MAHIELRDIYKSFGTNQVLRGLDLAVEPGETLALMGRSGIGKSVTLLIATGLIKPDRGSVLIHGQEINHLAEKYLIPIRKRISYVFQSGALFDSLTVFENVAFPLRESRKVEEPAIEEKVFSILDDLEIGGIADLMPAEISTGMKKCVAMARAIAASPEAILYDEPTTGVDPLYARLISRLIKKLSRRFGITSMVITHDIRCAATVSDRVAFIDGGRICFHDSFRRFIESGEVEALNRFKKAMPYLADVLDQAARQDDFAPAAYSI